MQPVQDVQENKVAVAEATAAAQSPMVMMANPMCDCKYDMANLAMQNLGGKTKMETETHAGEQYYG